MTLSVDELLTIQDLPEALRSEHCYNDLQHAMLVILFRHGLKSLKLNKTELSTRILDNITLYLYIHFLNEEEGMIFKTKQGWLGRDSLAEHSEQHLNFLDFWFTDVLKPFKDSTVHAQDTLEKLSQFYNIVIQHIGEEDLPAYGVDAVKVEMTRHELGRLSATNLPMSPFMAGALDTVKMLAPHVAKALDTSHLTPVALKPMSNLNLVSGIGPILEGRSGSLRDRFVRQTLGDQTQEPDSTLLKVG
ncbi:hypothetical protein V5T82_12625 [Magnetovibrio sp. PR-2]|uniref:hypothetical protein n=1 Tax=Magnetovibrio sp. PR-2 TaxID=3120356 RepID=UPI002FCE2F16